MFVNDKTKQHHINHRPGLAWRMPVLLASLSLSAFSVTALPLAAQAGSVPASKTDTPISRALTANSQTGWVSVIFKTNAPLTSAQEAQMTALGADIVRRLPIIQSVTVRLLERNLAKLAALPFAAHLSLDGKVQKADSFTVGSSEANQATAAVSAAASLSSILSGKASVTYQLTGLGVTVAVLDSGIAPVSDLSSKSGDILDLAPSRVLTSVNFSTALNGTGLVTGLTNTVSTVVGGSSSDNGASNLPLGSYSTNTYDPCGHGTHVAGIIAGNASRSPLPFCSATFKGIAPQANLVSVRVLDQNGESDVSTVIAGLQWVVANRKLYNIRVVNLSLGHPVGESYTTDPICQAVEAAYKAGIVVVCAAGNEGRLNGGTYTAGLDNEGWGTAYGSVQSPGNDPYIITVGATKNMDNVRRDDRIATYSSRGPSRLDLIMKPDIIAPGNKVVSLDAHGSALDNYANGINQIPYSCYVTPPVAKLLGLSGSSADYFSLSGTSMASPVVAGAAALLLQANPNLTPDTIKARLMLSADKWFAADGTSDPLTYGAGYLNIPAALASTAVAQGPAASPALSIDSSGNVTIVMNQALWGKSLWGTGVTDLRALWGNEALWSSNALSASRAMWGSNTTFSASRAMWGSSGIWGSRAMWGCDSTAVDLTSTAFKGE